VSIAPKGFLDASHGTLCLDEIGEMPIEKGGLMEQHPHPKGALTFMLIYLAVLSLFWVNSFIRLWLKG
jgi:hypothetical protein